MISSHNQNLAIHTQKNEIMIPHVLLLEEIHAITN